MIIPMNEGADPKSNVIEFKREKREGTIIAVRAAYGSCKHVTVTVDDGTKAVACKACKAPLDPFTVLYELANKQRRWLDELDAWDAYRESQLADRYDQVWAERAGDVTEPPDDPEMRRIWDVFRQYAGDELCGMYRRKASKRKGPGWYCRTVHGGRASYEYARNQLMKLTATKGSVE